MAQDPSLLIDLDNLTFDEPAPATGPAPGQPTTAQTISNIMSHDSDDEGIIGDDEPVTGPPAQVAAPSSPAAAGAAGQPGQMPAGYPYPFYPPGAFPPGAAPPGAPPGQYPFPYPYWPGGPAPVGPDGKPLPMPPFPFYPPGTVPPGAPLGAQPGQLPPGYPPYPFWPYPPGFIPPGAPGAPAAAPGAPAASSFAQLHSFASPASAGTPGQPFAQGTTAPVLPAPAATQPAAQQPASAPASTTPTQASAPAATHGPTVSTPASTPAATPAASHETVEASKQPQYKHEGDMELKSEGWLGEYWIPSYLALKNGRVALYAVKDGQRDALPTGSAFLIECNIGVSKDNNTLQIVHERKKINWTLRCPLGVAYYKQWIQMIQGCLKWYKSLTTATAEPTVMEQVIILGITRKAARTKENYRSLLYYTSKTSTGTYAIAAAMMMELLIRKMIEFTENGGVVIKDKSRTGVGVLDETMDILKHKLNKENKHMKLMDFLKFLATASVEPYNISVPVLRCIDLAVTNGHLARLGQKEYVVQNTKLEERLVQILRTELPPVKDKEREHCALAVGFTMLKVASKDYYYNQDVVDRAKVFPGAVLGEQLRPRVEALGKHLGGFHKQKVAILSALHTNVVSWLTGGKDAAGAPMKK